MKFLIGPHSGSLSTPPGDAIDLLWQRLGESRDEVSFAKVGPEISATWGDDASPSRMREERAEIGRRAVLEVLRDVCERSPELELDWFAIGFFH